MALLKTITLPSKVAPAYHRIAGVFILDADRICEIHLESYVNEATRRETEIKEDGSTVQKWQPIARPVCRLQGALFNAVFGPGNPEYPQKTDLYVYLKTEPQFVGALDVIESAPK